MTITFFRSAGTIAAFGFVGAAIAAILYLMGLPIFDAVGLAWVFFYGLILFGMAVLALIVRAIWETTP